MSDVRAGDKGSHYRQLRPEPNEATGESPGRRGRSKNSTAVSKFHCVLHPVSARNHSGAAAVVLLQTKSDPYPSVCPFGIAG